MHDKKTLEKLSRLRRQLLQLRERLEHVLAVALARTPLVKGNVYQIARRCVRPAAYAPLPLRARPTTPLHDADLERTRPAPPAKAKLKSKITGLRSWAD